MLDFVTQFVSQNNENSAQSTTNENTMDTMSPESVVNAVGAIAVGGLLFYIAKRSVQAIYQFLNEDDEFSGGIAGRPTSRP